MKIHLLSLVSSKDVDVGAKNIFIYSSEKYISFIKSEPRLDDPGSNQADKVALPRYKFRSYSGELFPSPSLGRLLARSFHNRENELCDDPGLPTRIAL